MNLAMAVLVFVNLRVTWDAKEAATVLTMAVFFVWGEPLAKEPNQCKFNMSHSWIHEGLLLGTPPHVHNPVASTSGKENNHELLLTGSTKSDGSDLHCAQSTFI